jgi:hypothetical protein
MTTNLQETQPPAFTKAIDVCIVRGFMANRRAMISKLRAMGFSRSAIVDRARELGLSKQFLKRCAIGNPDVGLRNCLGCGDRFLSVGFQNRLCVRCKNKQ